MNPSKPSTPTARGLLYRLLAGLFAVELTQENIEGFQKGPERDLLDTLESVDDYAPIAARLKEAFNRMPDPKRAALDLAESYAWNFHGVAGPHATPLYASVYLSECGSTHQETEREIYRILQSYGLSVVNYEREPCDHLSVILELVSWLDGQGDRAQQDTGHTTQKIIIGKYLLSWLPQFVAKCKAGDRLGFYAALAQDTLAMVEADVKQLG